MRRIALMVNSLQFGGAERVIAELSLSLKKQGYDVYLFLMDDENIAYKHGGKVCKISFYYKKHSFLMTFLTWQHFLLTWFYKLKYKIDVTISAMEFLNVVNLLTPGGGKKIVSLHNYKLQCEVTPILKERLIERLFRRKVRKAHAVVTVSEVLRRKALSIYKLPPGKIVTIYNSFNLEEMRRKSALPLPAGLKKFIAPNTFVNTSRLVEQKSLHKLIYAFSYVVKKHPDARLVIVGDGHLRKELRGLINTLGIQEKVIITGFLENPFNIAANSKAFVLCSHYEGFGNVLVEAMCCGTSVISTDCLCGPREIIAPDFIGAVNGVVRGEYGLLTTAHDGSPGEDKSVSDLSDAMCLMIEDENLCRRYSEKALIRARDFSSDIICAEWVKIIEG